MARYLRVGLLSLTSPRIRAYLSLLIPGLTPLLLILSISPWSGLDPVSGHPIFSIWGLSLGFILPLSFLVLAIIWSQEAMDNDQPSSRANLAPALLFFGVGLTFLSSQNALAILLAWGLLDLVFLWMMAQNHDQLPTETVRAARWNLLGMAFWFIFALTGMGGPLALFAIWVRLGVYPALSILTSAQGLPWPVVRMVQLVSISVGGYLLARYPGIALEGVWQVLAGFLAILAMVWGILSLWRERAGDKAGLYAYQVHMGFLLLALIAGLAIPPVVILLTTVSLILGWVVFDLAQGLTGQIAAPGIGRAPLIIAAANWLALPFTLGFGPRFWIYASLWEQGPGWLVVVGALSLALLFRPLLKSVLDITSQDVGSAEKTPKFAQVGVWLLSLTILGLGIYPDILLGPAGEMAVGLTPWNLVSFGTDKLLWVVLAILIPVLAGYLIFRWGSRFQAGEQLLVRSLAILRLEWLYGAFNALEDKLGEGLRRVASFGEGRGGWGWSLFLAILVLLWVIAS